MYQFHVAATQQCAEALTQAVAALQARAARAVEQTGVERQGDARGSRVAGQHVTQPAGREVVGLTGFGCLRLGRQRQQQRSCRQAIDGQGQRECAAARGAWSGGGHKVSLLAGWQSEYVWPLRPF